MSETLQKWLLKPVLYSELNHTSSTRRARARSELARDYFDRHCGGFGAVLVRNGDQLFPWRELEGNKLFLQTLFTPDNWEKIQADGRSKHGQVGATDIGGEQYHGAARANQSRYLHASPDGKPEILKQLGVRPSYLLLGGGMFKVAQAVAHSLEERLERPLGFFADQLSMNPESHTTFRHLDYPAGGWIEEHKDTSALSVVIAKPGYQLLIDNEWYEVEVAPWQGEGVVFIVNIGRTGSMWLTGDVRMATTHRVRTDMARQTSALFVHLEQSARWRQPVTSDIPSSNLSQGSLVYNFALDDFGAHGAKDDIPASS